MLLFFTLFFGVYYYNCLLDLYNIEIQTTIILFTRNMPSHKTDLILKELPLPVLSFISQGKQFNEYTWRRLCLASWNLYKCKQVVCSVVVACLLVYLVFYTALCCCMFTSWYLFLYWCCCYIFGYLWSCKQAHYFHIETVISHRESSDYISSSIFSRR